MYSLLFALLLLIGAAHAHVVQAATPMNQTCLNFGRASDCRFYTCFEERFPCGPTYWTMKWGYKYCERMQQSLSLFDRNGQELIKRLSSCLIKKALKQRFYKLNAINCDALRTAGQRMVNECYMQNAKLFCDAYEGKNRDCFFQLTDSEDRHDLNVIRMLTSVGQRCTPKKRPADLRPNKNMQQCVPSPTLG